MIGEAATAVTLVLGIGFAFVAAIGVAVARDVYDRLHFLGPASLASVLLGAAVWIDNGPSLIAVKATLLALVVVGTAPVTAHLVSRSARIRERGDWRWSPADGEVER